MIFREMTKSDQERIPPSRRRVTLALSAALVAAFALYAWNVKSNPPGYYIDESSISFNAYTISQTGCDEFDECWPLFFRAFGDYKNPVYVYLLAALYALTGPSILVARLFSAALGFVAALLLGLLAMRVTGRRGLGLLVALTALLTPWLFELSRVVVEVSLYPLALALLLLCAHRARVKERWSWLDAACLAASLALVTYTYSIGRLLGPLLALGLVFFASRARRAGVLLAWFLYALTLVPMLVFWQRHPDALTGRFTLITYIKPDSTTAEIVWEFVKHYAGNFNPWKLFVVGDPNSGQIAHLHGSELLLAATAPLAVAGVWLVLRRHGRDAWWRFVLYGLVVSVVPASLTKDQTHMLRLAPLLVFLLVLTIPAFELLATVGGRRRATLKFVVLMIVLQGLAFQWRFHACAYSPKRVELFDNGYPEKIFARAVASPNRPIYIADALAIPGYIQAYWNATLRRVPLSDFVRLAPDESPPAGALVITTEDTCVRCDIVSTSEFYKLYVKNQSSPEHVPLTEGGFRAAISVDAPPSVLRAGQKAVLQATVRNEGNSVWLARERAGGRFQVSLGNHWLDSEGRDVINDDGRSVVLKDVRPGGMVKMRLTVNVPRRAGEYLLELDMLQEGVSWFGLKGSKTMRIPVRVE